MRFLAFGLRVIPIPRPSLAFLLTAGVAGIAISPIVDAHIIAAIGAKMATFGFGFRLL